jgi:hypothetical protein
MTSVEIISSISQLLISYGKGFPFNKLEQPFTCVTKITINDYVTRLLHFFKTEQNTVILSLIYLNKLSIRHNVGISENNFHKLFLIALTTATKFNEYLNYNNWFYSKVGGIKLNEFNCLEKHFLTLIDYSLYIGKEQFTKYEKFFKLYYKVLVGEYN